MWALRIRWWEGAILIVAGTLALLFFIGESWVPGLVLTALSTLGFAWRAEIPERNEAGGYARTRSVLLSVQWLAIFALYILIVVGFFVMWLEHWTRDRHGKVAFYALAGLAFFLVRECNRLASESNDWWNGSDMERQVGNLLDELRGEGWSVAHDLPKDRGGNIDHYVRGPGGAFAIETKSGRDRAGARGQAVSNAVWAQKKFGERWVTGILCVATDPPAKPTKHGHCWVVGTADLLPLLRGGGHL